MTEHRASRTDIPGEYNYRGYTIRNAKDDYAYKGAFIDGNTWEITGPDIRLTLDTIYFLHPSKRSCMNGIDRMLEERDKKEKADAAFLKLKETIDEAFKAYEAELKNPS